MFDFDEALRNFDQISAFYPKGDNDPNAPSAEVFAGGAAFIAIHQFEESPRQSGQPLPHGYAKDALVGLAGMHVDRLAETQYDSNVHRETAKPDAQKKVCELYDQCYGDLKEYNPSERGPNPRLKEAIGI